MSLKKTVTKRKIKRPSAKKTRITCGNSFTVRCDRPTDAAKKIDKLFNQKKVRVVSVMIDDLEQTVTQHGSPSKSSQLRLSQTVTKMRELEEKIKRSTVLSARILQKQVSR